MKYNDNGTYKDIYVKTFDTLPVGAEVDYDGSVVPDGWTEVADPNTYSTDEVRIGTWIDGKSIYRKCLSYTGDITNGLNVQHGITNLDKMIKLYGYFINVSSQGLLPFNNKNTNYIIDFDNITSTKFTWTVGSGFNLSDIPIVVVMEYTKTTD